MKSELEAVFDALNRAEVRYLVVGGVAVVLHGHLRTTQDLDLVIQLDPGNVKRTLEALSALGFVPSAPVPMSAFADAEQRALWVREKGLVVFSLWSQKLPGFSVDVFAEEPFDFDAVYRRALRVPLDRVEATVIARADLIDLEPRLVVRSISMTSRRWSSSIPTRALWRSEPMSGADMRPTGKTRGPWQRQRRGQDRVGLRMTPAQRLRWLEETMATLRRWCGRARAARPIQPE